MATVTGLTAERMIDIENASVVGGGVVGDNLILSRHDGSTINAGNVRGPEGPPGGTAAGVGQVACLMKTASQTIPDVTETTVTWLGTRSAPYFDYTTWFTHSAGILTLKAGMAGVYDFTAFLYWASSGNAGTRRIMAIDWAAASGGTFYRSMRNDASAKATAAAAAGVQVTDTIPLVAGNQIKIVGYQDGGSGLGQTAIAGPDGTSYGFLKISRRV